MRTLFILLLLSGPALAQHNHAQGHSQYQNWQSLKTGNCCNDQDCGSIDDRDVRQTNTGPEVLIAGQWCAVQTQHRLTRGKSPDWGVNHACVSRDTSLSPCDRLLCFSPKGGF